MKKDPTNLGFPNNLGNNFGSVTKNNRGHTIASTGSQAYLILGTPFTTSTNLFWTLTKPIHCSKSLWLKPETTLTLMKTEKPLSNPQKCHLSAKKPQHFSKKPQQTMSRKIKLIIHLKSTDLMTRSFCDQTLDKIQPSFINIKNPRDHLA